MRVYKKAILPVGFRANGVACGIKKSGKLDLALFISDLPAKAACKFTTNKLPAAPVIINKKYLRKNKEFRAIVVNSGNANAFCAEAGLSDAEKMSVSAAEILAVKKENILVASTGIIAKKLPIEKIEHALPDLVKGLSKQAIDKAKRAILTTDKFTKELTVKVNIAGRIVTVCGVAKGAGMIAPNMATMLCFIFTDANITQRVLDLALTSAVDNSFNLITVDGCMSTSDSVMLLANGQAKNSLIDTDKYFNDFCKAINMVCFELAKMVVKDGEGATKFIRIEVNEAKNYSEARKVGLSIANSNLFKTAMYASSLNVKGRIIASVGSAGVDLKEKDLKIKFSDLKKKDIEVKVSLAKGKSEVVIYTSDLSHEYVKINAEYN
ncbi:MAG: bifunctional glutamate N-acetyltransferase/amino-acid acetyltransferase ArgJ [Candidatus Omnitrophota bacterium]